MTLKDPVNVVISGVGGQGVLLAAASIAEAGLAAGQNVYLGEVHGMAQRGGTVIATVRMGPVTSAMVSPGEASVVLGLEAVETYRMKPYLSPATYVVMNERRIPPVSVNLGHEKYPANPRIVAAIRELAGPVLTVPALKLALQAGSRRVENVVLLGALAAAASLPVEKEQLRHSILELVPSKWRAVNQRAFELGLRHGERRDPNKRIDRERR